MSIDPPALSVDSPSASFVTTRNACHLCTPLGAALVFLGIENAVPLLHGSQGCSTYIRRYLIGHYREPIDIASSNFSESSAVYGGASILATALENIIRQYSPSLVGIATTCLSETIGDDVRLFLHEFRCSHKTDPLPELIHVSTPSYSGTHFEGFHAAVRAVVEGLARGGPREQSVNVLPGLVSPADLRHLREIVEAHRLTCNLLPDYSDTLDGPSWEDYKRLPPGGTPPHSIRAMGRALASFELGFVLRPELSAACWLEEHHQVERIPLLLPIGIQSSDAFFDRLSAYSGHPTPSALLAERGRLVDAYIDGHKYLAGQRALIYGEPDLVVALTAFLLETGVKPVLCASGARTGRLASTIAALGPGSEEVQAREGVDFLELEEAAASLNVDFLIGHSKGYALSRKLGIPLVRVGFPVHDRIGASRILHVGYRGTQQLFDRITNTLIEARQDNDPNGYMNM